jgi:hypothetical protein
LQQFGGARQNACLRIGGNTAFFGNGLAPSLDGGFGVVFVHIGEQRVGEAHAKRLAIGFRRPTVFKNHRCQQHQPAGKLAR